MPSHFSVQSPTILQPFKLLSSSYKKSYLFINAMMMIIKRKKYKEKMEKSENVTLLRTVFNTYG